MEYIENYMVMPQPEYNTNWEELHEIEAEKADIAYQDMIFEEMMAKEEMQEDYENAA
jgi:hypothetical protein